LVNLLFLIVILMCKRIYLISTWSQQLVGRNRSRESTFLMGISVVETIV
jgi:hypothetical protein